MLKSGQNSYYKVGVLSDGTLLDTYVTRANIIKKGDFVHEKFMDFLYKEHGKDIVVVFSKKNGNLPRNSKIVDVIIPSENIKYNK